MIIVLRICSNFSTVGNVKPKNNKPKLIDEKENFNEKRREALKKVEREPIDKNRVIAPIDFNPHQPNVSQVFQKHHKAMTLSAPHLLEMFPSPPMPSYRQPDNLRNLICKSKLYPQNRSKRLQRCAQNIAPGWNKCGKLCKVCPFTLEKFL